MFSLPTNVSASSVTLSFKLLRWLPLWSEVFEKWWTVIFWLIIKDLKLEKPLPLRKAKIQAENVLNNWGTHYLALKNGTYQEVRMAMCYLMPPVTNLQWASFFLCQRSTPQGGTFTLRSATVVPSNGASRPQLSSAAQAIRVFFFFFLFEWAVAWCI